MAVVERAWRPTLCALFCTTWALSLDLWGLARVKHKSGSPSHLVKAWLMNSPPLSVPRPTSGNGRRASIWIIAAIAHRWAPFLITTFAVHPVNTSVVVNECTNSPCTVGPHCSTRSASTNPGACSYSSPGLRTWIELRSNGPDLRPGQRGQLSTITGGFQQPVNCPPRILSTVASGCAHSTVQDQAHRASPARQPDRHRRGQLIQHHALDLLRHPGILSCVLLRTLSTRTHRQ